jgi:transketolase
LRNHKGKGVSFVEGQEGWHGKAFKKGEELDRALAELEKQFVPAPPGVNLVQQIPKPAARPRPVDSAKPVAPPAYKLGEAVATREA